MVKPSVSYVFEPEIFQHCQSRPLPPGRGAPSADWRDYIADLHAWGADCEAKVNGGRAWSEAQRVTAP